MSPSEENQVFSNTLVQTKQLLTPLLPRKCTNTGGGLTTADSYLLAELVTSSASAGAVDPDLAFLSLFRIQAFHYFTNRPLLSARPWFSQRMSERAEWVEIREQSHLYPKGSNSSHGGEKEAGPTKLLAGVCAGFSERLT